MCIICIKKKGQEMPTEERIRTMFTRNPDGAGYMYTNDKGEVVIRKGFMRISNLLDSLEDLKTKVDIVATPIVFHFRIGTEGGNIPANTHPFPISHDITALQKLRLKCKLGVVHNGIIDIKTSRSDISDTMEYITTQMSYFNKLMPDFYKTSIGREMVYNAITSKMAILNADGEVYTIGEFVTDEEDGLMYSNSTYKASIVSYGGKYYNWGSYYDDADEYFENYGLHTNRKKVWSQYLMPLIDGDYVIDVNGNYIDASDYLYYVDAFNRVYLYDMTTDICSEVKDAGAFTMAGLPKKYDIKDCELIPVQH